jgi:hypothetical protein
MITLIILFLRKHTSRLDDERFKDMSMLPGKLNKLVLNLALTITPSADSRGRCCACDEVSRDSLIRRDSCYEPQLLLLILLTNIPLRHTNRNLFRRRAAA